MKQNYRKLLMSGALLFGLGMGTAVLPPAQHVPQLVSLAHAQEEATMEALFSPGSTSEEFAAAQKKAKAEGASEQLLLESSVIRSFYSQDKQALVTLLKPLQDAGAKLELEESQLFQKRTDYESLVEGISALQAEQQDNAAAFEKHIKEAVWLASPMLQPVYLSWLNTYRAAAEMKNVRVPLELELQDSEGKTTSLKAVLGDGKAILVDFWAEWCAPCMNAMGELKEKGAALAPQGVVVAGLNTEKNGVEIAARVKKNKEINLPWLVEPSGQPYSRLLNIDSIPRMVLVSPQGEVLYNGHPSDPALKTALAKVGAKL